MYLSLHYFKKVLTLFVPIKFLLFAISGAVLLSSINALAEVKLYQPARSTTNVRGPDGGWIAKSTKGQSGSIFAVDVSSTAIVPINGKNYEAYEVLSGIEDCQDKACYVVKSVVSEVTETDQPEEALQSLVAEAKEVAETKRQERARRERDRKAAEAEKERLRQLAEVAARLKKQKAANAAEKIRKEELATLEKEITEKQTKVSLTQLEKENEAAAQMLQGQEYFSAQPHVTVKKTTTLRRDRKTYLMKVQPGTVFARIDHTTQTIKKKKYYKVTALGMTSPERGAVSSVDNVCTLNYPCYVSVDDTEANTGKRLKDSVGRLNAIINKAGLGATVQTALKQCENDQEVTDLYLNLKRNNPARIRAALHRLCAEKGLKASDELIAKCGSTAIKEYTRVRYGKNNEAFRCFGGLRFACQNSLWKCKNFDQRLKTFKDLARQTIKKAQDTLKTEIATDKVKLSQVGPLSKKEKAIIEKRLQGNKIRRESQLKLNEKETMGAMLCIGLTETHHLEPSTPTVRCSNSSAYGLGQIVLKTFSDYYCRLGFRSQLPELADHPLNQPNMTFEGANRREKKANCKKAAKKMFDRLAVSPAFQVEMLHYAIVEKRIEWKKSKTQGVFKSDRQTFKTYHGGSGEYNRSYTARVTNCFNCMKKQQQEGLPTTVCHQQAIKLKPKMKPYYPAWSLRNQNKSCKGERPICDKNGKEVVPAAN